MNKTYRPIALISVLITTMHLGCNRDDAFSPRFGIVPIAIPGGHVVYLKWQARGLTYDELAISPNGDRCTPANPETDYVFTGLGAGDFPVFYSTSLGILTVYDAEQLDEPKHPVPGVKIVAHWLSPGDYDGISKSFASKGISKINIDVKTLADCP